LSWVAASFAPDA
jgi:HlyD family secretion protein